MSNEEHVSSAGGGVTRAVEPGTPPSLLGPAAWIRQRLASSPISQRVLRASFWVFGSYAASQVLRFASNLVLSRLLFPELFGLMALVFVFITGLQLFSDIGIGPSIIRNKRGDDPVFLDTAWSMQAVRGVVLWIGCFVAAVPASRFYEEPRLLWLIPLVGFTTVLSGLNSTAIFTLNRHLAVRQLALYELSAQAVSIGVMLTWAWFDRSIFALVAGSFVSSVFQLVRSWQLNPGPRHRFTWDREAIKEVASFGKWVFLSTAMTFLAGQTDRLIFARLLSIEWLGVYGIAVNLADIPRH
ncbi:MAG: oligosaccharide flippase family protein, partial [Acidobacteria bacterium]|nr:oligosaccharide flippase family protein [Acidobacteriota bacterium]